MCSWKPISVWSGNLMTVPLVRNYSLPSLGCRTGKWWNETSGCWVNYNRSVTWCSGGKKSWTANFLQLKCWFLLSPWPSNNASAILVNTAHAVATQSEWNVCEIPHWSGWVFVSVRISHGCTLVCTAESQLDRTTVKKPQIQAGFCP